MDSKTFENFAKQAVANYTNKHLDVTDGKIITTDDVFVVWYSNAPSATASGKLLTSIGELLT